MRQSKFELGKDVQICRLAYQLTGKQLSMKHAHRSQYNWERAQMYTETQFGETLNELKQTDSVGT